MDIGYKRSNEPFRFGSDISVISPTQIIVPAINACQVMDTSFQHPIIKMFFKLPNL